jgi:hypothetical protein
MSRFIIILLLASLACGQVITDPAPLPTAQAVYVQVSEPLGPPSTVTPTVTATSTAGTPAPLIQTLPTP